MTSFLPGRRRADQFAQVVEGTRTTRDPRVTQLLEVVDRVRRPATIEPSEQFATDLRQRLLAEAVAIRETAEDSATRPDGTPALDAAGPPTGDDADFAASGSGNQRLPGEHRAAGARRLPPRPRTRVLAATTAITLVAGTFGIVSFARDAMPGETLYGLKRSLEDTQAVIATNSESRGRHYLASGRARLNELGTLINSDRVTGQSEQTEQAQDRNRTQPTNEQQDTGQESDDSSQPEDRPEIDPDRVALARSTLQDFARQTEQGGNLLLEAYESDHEEASLEQLQQFTEESGRELAALAPTLPEELGDSFTEATRVLYELDERIGGFCADCVSLTPAPEEPSPTPSETPTPTPTPTTPSPSPSTPDDQEPTPDPTDTVSRQPENPSPSPRLPDEEQDEDRDDVFPLPTELPLPLF